MKRATGKTTGVRHHKQRSRRRVVQSRKAKSARGNQPSRPAVKQHKNSKKTAGQKSGVPDHLKAFSWKPGQSGNPRGRPKSNPITDAYRDILTAKIPDDPADRTFAQAIAQVQVSVALKGDVKAAREITNRVEGRPKQAIELSTPVGRPLEVQVLDTIDQIYGPRNRSRSRTKTEETTEPKPDRIH